MCNVDIKCIHNRLKRVFKILYKKSISYTFWLLLFAYLGGVGSAAFFTSGLTQSQLKIEACQRAEELELIPCISEKLTELMSTVLV